MTPAKRILIGLAALIILLLAAVIVVVATVDLNRFKPAIARAAEQQLGRELIIDGEIGWSLWPALGVALEDVHLSNAAGFGDEPMVAIDRLSLGVALLPLLSGELRVSEIVLERPAIALAVAADGRTNWDDIVERLAQDEPAAPADDTPTSGEKPMALAIEGVRISDGTVQWHDATTGQQLQVAPFDLRTGAFAADSWMPLEIALQVTGTEPALAATVSFDTELLVSGDFTRFEWRDLVMQLDASGAELPFTRLTTRLTGDGSYSTTTEHLQVPVLQLEGKVQLADAAEAVPLRLTTALDLQLAEQQLRVSDLKAGVGGIELGARLDGSRIIDAPAFRGTLTVAPFSPRAELPALGVELPPTTDASALTHLGFSAELAATADSVALSALQLALDQSQLTGSLRAGLGDITDVAFDLKIDAIDLDRYLPPESETSAPASGGDPAPAPAGTEDPWSWMDGLAAKGTVRAERLTAAGLSLAQINAALTLRDRVLTVDPLTARLYGGEQRLTLRFDASQPLPATRVQVALSSISIGDLLGAWMTSAPLRGTAALQADLSLTGLEPEQIRRSLSGSGEFRIRDGALQGINVAQELRNAMALLRGQPRTDAVAETDFTELVLPFTADQGLVQWPALDAQSPLLRLASKGRINLVTDELRADLDAAVVKTLEGQGGEPLSELAGFTVPIKLRGTLSDPEVKLDVKDLLAQTRLGEKREELEGKVDERKEQLREKARDELQRGLERLLR